MGQFLICLLILVRHGVFACLPSPLSLPQRVLHDVELLSGGVELPLRRRSAPPLLLHAIWPLLFQYHPVQQGHREQFPFLAFAFTVSSVIKCLALCGFLVFYQLNLYPA